LTTRTVLLLLLVWLVPGFGVEGALAAILISQLLNAAVFGVDLSKLNLAAVTISSPVAHAMLFVLNRSLIEPMTDDFCG